ncbi:HIT-like protein [Flagelloscypha sp. PMI_526]|nr:HIT-like protein [Flagelloscypha sp. PMI_526]KAH8801918.1 HIT-like protein [Flagelloscypha sp. PMI_526]
MSEAPVVDDQTIAGKIPSSKVYEDDYVLAILDINPVSEGHTQVLPKYHAQTIATLPDEYLSAIGPVLKKVAIATEVKDYNIVQNNGAIAYQYVNHVHFHVVPKPNEREGLCMTDIEKMWPMKTNTAREVLDQVATRMREKLEG